MSTNNFSIVINELTPRINKVCYEVYQANKDYIRDLLPEDYFQEITTYLFTFCDKLTEEQLQDKVQLSKIFNTNINFLRRHYMSKKPYLTNKKRGNYEYSIQNMIDDEDTNRGESTNILSAEINIGVRGYHEFESDFVGDDFRVALRKKIMEYESKATGITRFFDEATEPSDEVVDKFKSYIRKIEEEGRTKRMLDGENIPPLVLMDLIGEKRSRIKSFKKYITFALCDLGVDQNLIIKKWKLAHYFLSIR